MPEIKFRKQQGNSNINFIILNRYDYTNMGNSQVTEQFSTIIKQLEFQSVRAGVAVKVNISQEHPLNESAYSSLRSTLVSHFIVLTNIIFFVPDVKQQIIDQS